MECLHCKGKMVQAEVPYSVNRKGYRISWDSIPAWVCTQCGEPFFEAGEIGHIQNALEKIDQETSLLSGKVVSQNVALGWVFVCVSNLSVSVIRQTSAGTLGWGTE